jgi:hypothetical protein
MIGQYVALYSAQFAYVFWRDVSITGCGEGLFQSVCDACPVGTFKSTLGSAACTNYPTNTYSGLTVCTSNTTCTPCYLGWPSRGGGLLKSTLPSSPDLKELCTGLVARSKLVSYQETSYDGIKHYNLSRHLEKLRRLNWSSLQQQEVPSAWLGNVPCLFFASINTFLSYTWLQPSQEHPCWVLFCITNPDQIA